MKNQALFSSKDKSKKLKCCLLQLLFCTLRVKFFQPWPFSSHLKTVFAWCVYCFWIFMPLLLAWSRAHSLKSVLMFTDWYLDILHFNSFSETIPIRGHREIRKIIHKLFTLPLLSGALLTLICHSQLPFA